MTQSKCDPVVALISTYKEGWLLDGTLRSINECCEFAVVFEGATEPSPPTGLKTKYNPARLGFPVYETSGRWHSETDKRNKMLAFARIRMKKQPFWILTIDADEILIWGEYLTDWLAQIDIESVEAETGTPIFAIPLKRTEPSYDEQKGWYADYVPSRLLHSSCIDHYTVGCWQFRTTDGLDGVLQNGRSPIPPQIGEPHIHHRHYLRRGDRKSFRASDHEEARWLLEHGMEVPERDRS